MGEDERRAGEWLAFVAFVFRPSLGQPGARKILMGRTVARYFRCYTQNWT
jgi:hypothetical protein